jgi:hypothetical protein
VASSGARHRKLANALVVLIQRADQISLISQPGGDKEHIPSTNDSQVAAAIGLRRLAALRPNLPTLWLRPPGSVERGPCSNPDRDFSEVSSIRTGDHRARFAVLRGSRVPFAA